MYQNGEKYKKFPQNYQMTIKYTNGCNIFQMGTKPAFSILRLSKTYPN
jgi:hypothetical protein